MSKSGENKTINSRNSPAKMRTGKGNQEEEDYGEEDFNSKREGPSSNTTVHSNRGKLFDLGDF
jgi:hypothetical protein